MTEQLDSRVHISLDRLMRLQHQAVGFSFLPRQPIHSLLAGRHSSTLRGRGLNFEELRRYRSGDDIRMLDWKVTRRLKKPHVRVFTEEKERTITLVVDQRVAMFFGSKQAMKSVVAAELAALAGWRGLSSGDRIGAVIFNDQTIVELKPQRSRHQLVRILNEIADFNQRLSIGALASPEQLNQVLKRVCQQATHDNLICIISDLTGADSTTDQAISRLSQHNDVLLGFVYDSFESSLPKGGKLAVSDGDLQIEIDTNDGNLREQYQSQFDHRLNRARDYFQKRGVPVLPINTEQAVVQQLRELLNQSGHRGAMVARLQGRA